MKAKTQKVSTKTLALLSKLTALAETGTSMGPVLENEPITTPKGTISLIGAARRIADKLPGNTTIQVSRDGTPIALADDSGRKRYFKVLNAALTLSDHALRKVPAKDGDADYVYRRGDAPSDADWDSVNERQDQIADAILGLD